MSGLLRICVVLAAAVMVPAMASAAEECRNFGAVGSGLNESVATLMALQGAVNVAEGRGYTVKGEATLVKCESTGIFGTECTARSHACKRVQ